tara:strand:- start:1309 stop:1512 length:204 start_codon:yes stop_codon:yes gene_type:complete
MENNIGKRVHDELHRLRVPVAEMEKILHTSRQTIYKWSKNLSSPKGKNLEKAIILLSIINRVKDKKG